VAGAPRIYEAQQRTVGRTTAEGGSLDLALGGGAEMLTPAAEGGRRVDGRHLIREAEAAGAAVVRDAEGLAALAPGDPRPVLGVFAPDHMAYDYDRREGQLPQPSLAAMTAAAVRHLSALSSGAGEAEGGYYLMVEGGRVDHSNHAGELFRTVTDGLAYQDAVAWALEHTDPAETLLISTADHSHGLEFHGYCGRGSPINGLCYGVDDDGEAHLPAPELASDGLPYTVAGYLNGAGSVLNLKFTGLTQNLGQL
jgi:alkaline phosphatase